MPTDYDDRVAIRTWRMCSECGQHFDLTDETEAQEWHYGHDCEESDDNA